jgi:hypothetical protein
MTDQLTKTEILVCSLVLMAGILALTFGIIWAIKWVPNEKDCFNATSDCKKSCLTENIPDLFDLCVKKCGYIY